MHLKHIPELVASMLGAAMALLPPGSCRGATPAWLAGSAAVRWAAAHGRAPCVSVKPFRIIVSAYQQEKPETVMCGQVI